MKPTIRTADDIAAYVRANREYPPGPDGEGWLEACAVCDEPTVCDDDAPDRGPALCSDECRADWRETKAQTRAANARLAREGAF